MVSTLTKLERQISKKSIKPVATPSDEVVDKSKKASIASQNLQTKPTAKISKKSMEMQIETMTQIFSKPIEEREKSDKEKIVMFLRLGVPFLADIQLPLLHLLAEKLEPVKFQEGEISNILNSIILRSYA